MKLPKLTCTNATPEKDLQPTFQPIAPQGWCETACQVAYAVCKSQGGGALCDIGLAACLEAC